MVNFRGYLLANLFLIDVLLSYSVSITVVHFLYQMSPKKRCIIAKKQQINKAAATIQNDPRHLRTSDGDSNSPTTECPNVPDVQVENNQPGRKPKPRGKAKVSCFTKGKGKGTRLEVEFNEKRQPFSANEAKLFSFLGITARELIPVTLDK